jgi:hypothetical protein
MKLDPLLSSFKSTCIRPNSYFDWFYVNCFYENLQNYEKRLLDSSCLSIRIEQSLSHWTYFHEIWYLMIFSEVCWENSSFVCTFMKISRWILLNMRNISDKFAENFITRVFYVHRIKYMWFYKNVHVYDTTKAFGNISFNVTQTFPLIKFFRNFHK